MNRQILLGGLIFLFFLVGLGTLNGGLLALTLPLVIYLGSGLIFGPYRLQFDITRTIATERIIQGEEVEVELEITNRGARLEEVLVEDLVPPELALIEGANRKVLSFDPNGKGLLGYTLRGVRGNYRFPGVRVTASDYLGVARASQTFPISDRLFVLPRILNLRRVAIRPVQTKIFSGQVPARQGGAGVDFWGVREYQRGDPLRWVNWKASERRPPQMFTNEFEQERVADVGLVLDARKRSSFQQEGDMLFEYAVLATASLANSLLEDGHRVGLLLYGDFLDWTFPGYGKLQRERILRALSRATPGESMVFERLENIPARLFPVNTQLVVVSSLLPDDLKTLVRLRARGYQVIVVSPDPISFEMKSLEPGPHEALAVRIAYLERKLVIRELLGAGIRVLDWKVDTPFDEAVHAVLHRMPPWSLVTRVRR